MRLECEAAGLHETRDSFQIKRDLASEPALSRLDCFLGRRRAKPNHPRGRTPELSCLGVHMGPQDRTVERILDELASSEHGVVTRGALLDAGVSPKQIRGRIE